jgi:hypothetical protein
MTKEGGMSEKKADIDISAAAAAMGRKGGAVKSAKKTAAVRENAKKGGWPKGRPRKAVK